MQDLYHQQYVYLTFKNPANPEPSQAPNLEPYQKPSVGSLNPRPRDHCLLQVSGFELRV